MAKSLQDNFTGKQPSISQQTGAPAATSFDKIDQLIIVVPERPSAALWRQLPQGNKIKALMKRRGAKSIPAAVTRLANKRNTGLLLACMPKDADAFARLTFGRELVAAASKEQTSSLGLWVAGFSESQQAEIVADLTAAALAAAYVMPAFKSKPDKAPFRSLHIVGLDQKLDLSRTIAEAEGTNLVRYLTALPPNKLDANAYVAFTKEMAADNGWKYKKYGIKELEKVGAGAFLAVAQGNEDESAAIVHLQYRPNKKSAAADLSLVGKGIIFDTGGTNLKPFMSMLDMHTDMSGSAVALAAFKVISDLQMPLDVDCWLAITENRTGPLAYKSQDVLTAANGKTIQTIHTDAEGRLALADTLVLASRKKPGLIIDYATLTGSCVVGVSTRYSGVFSNQSKLHPVMKRAGRKSGERVWPFPMGQEFVDGLKSETADLMQCAVNEGGDHIYAASFLGEFVENSVPWIHVDLSACAHKGGLAHVPTEITGFGVRFTMNLIIDQDVLGNSH